MTVPDSWTLDGLIEAFKQHQRRTRGLRDTTLHGYAPLVRGLFARPSATTRSTSGDSPLRRDRVRCHDDRPVLSSLDEDRRARRCGRSSGSSASRDCATSGSRPRSPRSPTGGSRRCLGVSATSSSRRVLASLRRLHAVRAEGPRDRVVPGDPGAPSWRGRRAASGRHRLARRAPSSCARARRAEARCFPCRAMPGRAIVDYLRRERPKTSERRVFVQHLGHRRGEPISSTVVSGVVVRAPATRWGRGAARRRLRLPAHRGEPHGAAGDEPQGGRRLPGAPLSRHHDDLRQARPAGAPRGRAAVAGGDAMTPPSLARPRRRLPRPAPRTRFRRGAAGLAAARLRPLRRRDRTPWSAHHRSRRAMGDVVGPGRPGARRTGASRPCDSSRDTVPCSIPRPRSRRPGCSAASPAASSRTSTATPRSPRCCASAAGLRPRGGLRPVTYVAFFSLLVSTGLRLSEACRLECARRRPRHTASSPSARASSASRASFRSTRRSVQALTRYAARRDAFAGRSTVGVLLPHRSRPGA